MPEEKVKGINQVIQDTAFNGFDLDHNQIKEYLKRDIRGIYVLLADILNSPDVLDAMAAVMLTRYEALRAKEKEKEARDGRE